jgi:hypothetical protein
MLVSSSKEMAMASRRIDMKYLVVRTEELVIGKDAYRLEVLQTVYNAAVEPRVPAEPYDVRAYKRIEIEVRPAGRKMVPPVEVSVWTAFPLDNVHAQRTEDRALEEAHAALCEETKELAR